MQDRPQQPHLVPVGALIVLALVVLVMAITVTVIVVNARRDTVAPLDSVPCGTVPSVVRTR